MQGLRHLRLLGCPVLASLEESRAEVIARLPHITTLNGGDTISETEREDAERAMIRRYLPLAPGQRPARVEVLIATHGNLDPLVKIDLTPTVFVRVLVFLGEEKREMVISVRQRVRHFKRRLSSEFRIAPAQIRLWFVSIFSPDSRAEPPLIYKSSIVFGLIEYDCIPTMQVLRC